MNNLVPNKLASFFSTNILLISFSIFTFTSCSVSGMLNPDNYGRNHEVHAVDINSKDLNSTSLFKMNKGDWTNMG